ncbi:MAG: PAS domain S-box protein [Magnetococcales bacterium]|nr:PAS domain S-box protein [Magnetococcales bacterium]
MWEPILFLGGLVLGGWLISHRSRASFGRRSDRLHKKRLHQLIRTAPVGVFQVDAQGHYIYANRLWRQLANLSAGRYKGLHWIHALAPEDQPMIRSFWGRFVLESPGPFQFEYCFKVPDGDGIWVLCQIVCERDPSGPLKSALGVVTDISDRKRAEQERTLLAAAMEGAADFAVITDAHHRILYTNAAYEQGTGYSLQEVKGRSLLDLLHDNPEQVARQEMRGALSQGMAWKGQLENRRKDGSIYMAMLQVSPIRDEQDRVVRFVFVMRDVTHEQRLERQLRQGQKLEALGTLTGGIAHDFNNLLTPVLGFSEMALEELEPESRLYRNLKMVHQAGQRARDLVAQILTFSRCHEQDPKPTPLVPLIKEVLQLLHTTLPHHIEIQSHMELERGSVLADPVRIHQLVMNLGANAAYAMRRTGGVLAISLRRIEAASLEEGSTSELELTVRDDGDGMEPAVVERIFDPFFTTKQAGEGTGLGLSVAHGIVQGCQGRIEVESEPGVGSLFRVYLPECDPAIQHEEQVPVPLKKGGGRILWVDDEPMVLEPGRQILERLGYQVQAVSDPYKALAMLESDPHRFDLMLTDQTMPGMSGDALVSRVRRQGLKLPIILCSGYSEMMDDTRAREIGAQGYLAKPLTPRMLSEVLSRVLGN